MASIQSLGVGSSASFDYIIAGAGTCGLVLANRLSTDPNVTVAVIEPGEDVRNNPNVTSVSGFLAAFNTSIDWQYNIVPQRGPPMTYHAGKAIGGTSTINGMTYVRADAAEIDAWEALGNEGWNWETLWPYYKQAESFTVPNEVQIAAGASYVPEYHGEQGLLKTGFPYELMNGSFHQTVRRSWENLGYQLNPDPNGGDVHGFSVWPQTIDRDRDLREDAARAFYYPFEKRPNLKIIKGTVQKFVWQDAEDTVDKATAKGVEYIDADATKSTLTVSREVILSSGAIRTPLILELSGVGSPEVLAKHDIKTKIDLPGVGENLQDQPLTTLVYAGNTVNATGTTPYANFLNAWDIFGERTIDLAESTRANLSAWAETVVDANNNNVDAAALEHIFAIQHDLIFKKNITIGEILPNLISGSYYSVFWPLLPFSRGNVHLKSSDALDTPLIDPKYLLLDFDIEMTSGTGKVAQSLWYTEPISNLVTANVIPGVEALPRNATDKQWLEFLEGAISPNHHALGTASMMSRELGGVVDPQLKVYGTTNVRIVDASIIPLQLSGHLTSTLYAVAEKASELITATAVRRREEKVESMFEIFPC